METERMILGIYLEPSVWVCNEGEHPDPELMSPEECTRIVFSKALPNGVEVCVQRQGFVVVAFPEDLLGIKISEIRTANLLPIKAAQTALSFFNALLFLVYDQTYRYYVRNYQSLKQAVDISGIWRWNDDATAKLATIAVKQPMPVMRQDKEFLTETDLYTLLQSIGQLTKNDKVFRFELPSAVVDQALSLLFQMGDVQVNWQLLALLNKAVYSIQRADFAESHILSWSVAENLIETEWKNYILRSNEPVETSGEKTVNSERLKNLVSPDYSAAQRAEILELAKVIPFELFKRSVSARKARNDWLHNLKSVIQNDCRNCYLVARDLLSRKVGFNIEHPGAFYIQDESMPRRKASNGS